MRLHALLWMFAHLDRCASVFPAAQVHQSGGTKKTKAELEAEKRRKQKARKKRKTSKKLAAAENGGSEVSSADVTAASSQDDADAPAFPRPAL